MQTDTNTISDVCAEQQLPLQFADSGDVQMIKPQPVSPQSPLESLTATIALMGKNRKFLSAASTDPNWSTMLEDLEMLVTEKVVVGLRTSWARRVAVPVVNAHRALNNEHGDDQERARFALDILRQCTDAKVRDDCSKWVRERFHV